MLVFLIIQVLSLLLGTYLISTLPKPREAFHPNEVTGIMLILLAFIYASIITMAALSNPN